MFALDDSRFDVRFSRPIAGRHGRENPRIRIDRQRVEDVVIREVADSRPIWESGRLLTASSANLHWRSLCAIGQAESLAHVFTLLSLVLPREPLQNRVGELSPTTDGFEVRVVYLAGVLPSNIHQSLGHSSSMRRGRGLVQKREEIFAYLLRSSSPTLMGIAGHLQTRQGAGSERSNAYPDR